MPVSHITKVFAARDAKIAALTADPAGGTPTYGTWRDVPGIKTVEIGGDVNSVELRGDNSLLDSDSNLTNITVSFEFAKLDLDLMGTMLGGTVTDAGVAPAQTATFNLNRGNSLGYFGLRAQAVGADTIGGSVDFTLSKCILSGFPEIGLEEEDYRTVSVEANCIPLNATGRWLSINVAETRTDLSVA